MRFPQVVTLNSRCITSFLEHYLIRNMPFFIFLGQKSQQKKRKFNLWKFNTWTSFKAKVKFKFSIFEWMNAIHFFTAQNLPTSKDLYSFVGSQFISFEPSMYFQMALNCMLTNTNPQMMSLNSQTRLFSLNHHPLVRGHTTLSLFIYYV